MVQRRKKELKEGVGRKGGGEGGGRKGGREAGGREGKCLTVEGKGEGGRENNPMASHVNRKYN